MKDSRSRRGLVIALVLSLVANVVLLANVYVVEVRTHFYYRLGTRMGIFKVNPDIGVNSRYISGWTNTLKKMDYDADVVFIGSSIINEGEFQEYFPNVKTCNLGYSGDDPDGVRRRVDQIRAVHPEKVFVMTGINGLKDQTEKVFENKYQSMVDSIKCAAPEAEIYLQSILPVNKKRKKGVANNDKIREANKTIELIASRSGCVYVDLFSLYEREGEMPLELTRDGVHLLPESYDRWMEEIRPYIEE